MLTSKHLIWPNILNNLEMIKHPTTNTIIILSPNFKAVSYIDLQVIDRGDTSGRLTLYYFVYSSTKIPLSLSKAPIK